MKKVINQYPEWAFVAALAPLFVITSSPFLTAAFLAGVGSPVASEAVSLSIGAAAILGWALVVRRPQSLRGVLVPLSIFWLASILVGVAKASGLREVFFIAQSGVLLLALLGAYHLPSASRTEFSRDERLAGLLANTAILGTLVGAVASLYGGLELAVAVIPSFRSYYSILPAIAIGIALSSSFEVRHRLASLVAVAISIPSLWSRSGLVAVAVVAAFQAVAASRSLKGSIMALTSSVIGFLFLLSSGSLALTRNDELTGDSNLLSGRGRFFDGALEIIHRSPLFGDGFSLNGTRRLVRPDGTAITVEKPFTAHNQVLEWAVHLGIPTAVLLLILVVGAFRRLKHVHPMLRVVFGATLVSSAVLSLTHVPGSVLFPGVFLMMICGTLYGRGRPRSSRDVQIQGSDQSLQFQ